MTTHKKSFLPPRVLLAENDVPLRHLLRDALAARGFRVHEVEDGEAMLDALGSAVLGELPYPQLVLSDQRTAGTPGVEVLDGLRRAGWRLPFVLLTGGRDRVLEARVRALGGTAVTKLRAMGRLAQVVTEALSGAWALDVEAGPARRPRRRVPALAGAVAHARGRAASAASLAAT